MLLDVPAVVADALAGADLDTPLSLIRMQATRTLYLVFGRSADAPQAIVEFGSRHDLLRLHEVLTRLHADLPTLVPASLAYGPWRDGLYFHIQSGLPGKPWFNLRHRITSLDGWLAIRARAARALQLFHAAVARQPGWTRTVAPATELLHQLQLSTSTGLQWSSGAVARITAAADALGPIGVVNWPLQHGEFCFNNLLVTDQSLGLIDFEEFGGTAMPLHDELSLAFSSNTFMQPLHGSPPLAEHVSTITAPALNEHPELRPGLDGLVFHHLLWRINECASRPMRAPIRAALAQLVEQLARDGL